MNDIAIALAVRATLKHYAQQEAQRARERAEGQPGRDLQCRRCGLWHAMESCHPYALRLIKEGCQP